MSPYVQHNRVLAAKFSDWLEIQSYAFNTRRTYDTVTADFCRFIGSRNLMEVTHHDVRAYLQYLQGRARTGSTCERHIKRDVCRVQTKQLKSVP